MYVQGMHRIRFRRISEARILAGDQTGRKWEVMVIKAGLSHNLCPEGHRYFYDPAMLKEARPQVYCTFACHNIRQRNLKIT